MSANRTGLFFQEFTLAAAYTTTNIVDFVVQHTHLKLVQIGGDAEFALTGVAVGGSKVEGKILQDEELNFNDFPTERIAVRGSGTLRVWAWHQT